MMFNLTNKLRPRGFDLTNTITTLGGAPQAQHPAKHQLKVYIHQLKEKTPSVVLCHLLMPNVVRFLKCI